MCWKYIRIAIFLFSALLYLEILYDMEQCFAHTEGQRKCGGEAVLAARLNVLSSAFSHIFARHQMILLPEFSVDPDLVEAACIWLCSTRKPLGTSLPWGSGQFTRGFSQNHSTKVCWISFNGCEQKGISDTQIHESNPGYCVWFIHAFVMEYLVALCQCKLRGQSGKSNSNDLSHHSIKTGV